MGCCLAWKHQATKVTRCSAWSIHSWKASIVPYNAVKFSNIIFFMELSHIQLKWDHLESRDTWKSTPSRLLRYRTRYYLSAHGNTLSHKSKWAETMWALSWNHNLGCVTISFRELQYVMDTLSPVLCAPASLSKLKHFTDMLFGLACHSTLEQSDLAHGKS